MQPNCIEPDLMQPDCIEPDCHDLVRIQWGVNDADFPDDMLRQVAQRMADNQRKPTLENVRLELKSLRFSKYYHIFHRL